MVFCSECSSYGPASVYPSTKGSFFYTSDSTPFRYGVRDTIKSELNSILRLPFIFLLLLISGPSTIIRRVMAIVVDTVDRVFVGRPFTHILKERLKAANPSVTDHNTSRAVVFKSWVVGVTASFFHTSPSVVFNRPSISLIMPVDNCFTSGAPAGSGTPTTQRRYFTNSLTPTITNAQPKRVSKFVRPDFFDSHETSTPNTCHIHFPALTGLLRGIATAGFRLTRRYFIPLTNRRGTAITDAVPKRFISRIFMAESLYGKTVKLLTGKILPHDKLPYIEFNQYRHKQEYVQL